MIFYRQMRALKRALARSVKLIVGRRVFAGSNSLQIKERLAFPKEGRIPTVESIKSDSLKYYVLRKVLAEGGSVESMALDSGLEDIVNTDRALAEFARISGGLEYAEAGICNTEATVLWGLIKTFKPELYIESGTARGYSAQVACMALETLEGEPRFVTVGIDAGGQMDVARRRLASYPSCEIIEDKSENVVPTLLNDNAGKRIGMFIDGPKGSSPAFLLLLESIFQNHRPDFVAIHDCEAHIPYGFDKSGKRPEGLINLSRAGVEYFYHKQNLDKDYDLYYMSDDWCKAHEDINAPVYEMMDGFRPYYFSKSKQVSHSTIMAVLLNKNRLAALNA